MTSAETLSDDRNVISRSTILILSGVLLTASALSEFDPAEFCVFSSGAIGLIAFLTFEMIAEREANRPALQTAQFSVEQRLSRHVPALAVVSQDAIREQHELLEWLERETRDLHR